MKHDKASEYQEFVRIRAELPKLLRGGVYPPLEVSLDEAVTIRIDSQFEVSSITITEAMLRPEQAESLEQSLVKTINKAIQEVAKHNTERIMQAFGKSGN